MKFPRKLAATALGIAAFFLCLLLLVVLANTYLIQTDTVAALTMREMQSRDDIELAFVGSSIVRDHFNVQLISEQTGMNAFNATVPCASLPASIAITKELYRTNSPEWTVLVVEPYTFQTPREDTEAEYKLMPFLTDWSNKLEYYLRLCDEDGYYIDRLFIFREFGAKSISDVAKTIGLRHWPKETYARLKKTMDPTVSYEGGGFLRYTTDERADKLVRESVFREYTGYYYELFDKSKAELLEYKALCESNGSKLLILLSPNLTAHALAEPGFLEYGESLMRFCRDNGIPCYNFIYAKPEFMPRLDSYYFDLYHMVGEGADILSDAFCRFFAMFTAGEDVSSLFYENMGAYLDSIDFITNAWITQYKPGSKWNLAWDQDEATVTAAAQTHDVFMADSNRGAQVTPEYRLVLLEEDGSETLLQDYSTNTLYLCEPGALDGRTIRLYARPQGQTDADPQWFELTVGKESTLIDRDKSRIM